MSPSEFLQFSSPSSFQERGKRKFAPMPFTAVLLVIASYLCLYGLVSRAYSVGPAFLLLMSFFYIRRGDFENLRRFDLARVAAALSLYCLTQWLVLGIHGEDITEFDLAFRYIAASVVLIFVVKYPVSGLAIFSFCTIGASLSGIWAFYQLEFRNVARVESFDNAIHFGNGAMALAVICLCGLLSGLEKKLPLFLTAGLGLGFIFGMYAVLASGSRGVWVAFPAVALVLTILFWRRMPGKKKVLVGVVTAVGVVTLFQFPAIEYRINQGVSQYNSYFDSAERGTSVGLRLDMWKAGLVAFEMSPLVGVGPAGVDRIVNRLVEEELIHPTTATFRHLHSQYIDILARQGLVGFAFYALLIGSILYSFKQIFVSSTISARGHALAAAGIGFVVQHLVVSLTLSTLERSIGIMMFLFMAVFLLASAAGERKSAENSNL